MKEYKKGDVFYANLKGLLTVGSEQTGNRPVVIIQNDIGNKHSPTVIVADITSQVLRKKNIPTHMKIDYQTIGLEKESMILCEQIRTIDKMRLKEYVGCLSLEDMKELDRCLAVSLGIAS